MTIDPTKTIVIHGSPWRLLGIGFGGLLFAVGCLAVGLGWFGSMPPGDPRYILMLIGIPFFLLCGVIGLWRGLNGRGPVVTLAPQGIRDTRIAAEFVPWSAIRTISTWYSHGQNIMVLDVDPAVEARLTLTPIARFTRGANKALGADGLCVAVAGLKTSYKDLLYQTSAYAQAYNQPPPNDTGQHT